MVVPVESKNLKIMTFIKSRKQVKFKQEMLNNNCGLRNYACLHPQVKRDVKH